MRKIYRPSLARLAAYIFVSIAIGGLAAIGKSRPIEVFSWVAGVFLILTIIAWTNTGISFENGNLVKTRFLIYRTSRPVRLIKRVRIKSDVDSFGGRTVALIIEFRDERPTYLTNLDDAQMREIIEIIRTEEASAIDSSVNEYFAKERPQNLRSLFRPGDLTLVVGGLAIILILVLWQFYSNSL